MNPSDQVSTIPLCRKSCDNPLNLSWIHPIRLVRFRCAGVHLNLRRTCQQSDRYCFPRIWIFYILILMPLNLSQIDRTDGWIPVYYSFIGYVVFSVERGAEIHSQYVFLLLSPSLSPRYSRPHRNLLLSPSLSPTLLPHCNLLLSSLLSPTPIPPQGPHPLDLLHENTPEPSVLLSFSILLILILPPQFFFLPKCPVELCTSCSGDISVYVDCNRSGPYKTRAATWWGLHGSNRFHLVCRPVQCYPFSSSDLFDLLEDADRNNWLLYNRRYGCNRQTTPLEAMQAIFFFRVFFFGMHGVQLPVLVHKEDAWNCRWALVQNGENSLICGLTSLLRRLWHVNVRPRYQRWKVDNANTNKKVSTNKTFHSYWCGVSPLHSSVSLVIWRFLLLLPTPALLRLKYEEAMDRTHAQKWMIKIWMLRMQTNTKKKSPVLQQLRPPVPVMPHLGSTE